MLVRYLLNVAVRLCAFADVFEAFTVNKQLNDKERVAGAHGL